MNNIDNNSVYWNNINNNTFKKQYTNNNISNSNISNSNSNITNNNNINKVLENENVLNFMSNTKLKLPLWFNKLKRFNNKLWGGDFDVLNMDLNILSNYNVFYCYPVNNGKNNTYSIIYNNIKKLNRIYGGQNNYLICLIDIENEEQIKLFEKIFKNFFIKYQNSFHTPNLSFETISKILKNNGKCILSSTDPRLITIANLEELIRDKKFYFLYTIRLIHAGRALNSDSIFDNKSYNKKFNHLEYLLVENIYNLEENYVLSKFRLSSSFTEVYQYLIKKYSKNKPWLIINLYNIYSFLLLNFNKELPSNIIAVLDTINNINYIQYIKKDISNLNSFYNTSNRKNK